MKYTFRMTDKGFNQLKLLTLIFIITAIGAFSLLNIPFVLSGDAVQGGDVLQVGAAIYNLTFNSSNATGANAAVNFTLLLPENNTMTWEINNFTVNMTVNNSYYNCSYQIDTDDKWYPMINQTPDNKTWGNGSAATWATHPQMASGDYHNLSYFCYNLSINSSGLHFGVPGSSRTNETFTNISVYRFKFFTNTSYSFVLLSPANGTTHRDPDINVSLNQTAYNCSYMFGDSDAGFMPLNNTDENRTLWLNTSAVSYNDTLFGSDVWTNLTIACWDSVGNMTWMNTSTSGSAVGGNWTNFKIDRVAPYVHSVEWVLANITNTSDQGGNYLNASFMVQDNSSTRSLKIRGIYVYNITNASTVRNYEEGNVYNFSQHTYYNSTTVRADENQTRWGFINVTDAEIFEDGQAVFQIVVTDAAGNEGLGTAIAARDGLINFTAQVWRLRAGWNYMQLFDNATLGEIAGATSNISYSAVFNNQLDNKTWITFTTGGSTNKDIELNSSNITGLYLANDRLLIRNSSDREMLGLNMSSNIPESSANVTLYHNATNATGWNIVGMLHPTTLNKTMWNAGCDNQTSLGADACPNITWAAYYDASLGRFCTSYRSRRANTCDGYYSENYTIPQGGAVWLYTFGHVNMTYNRSRVYTVGDKR